MGSPPEISVSKLTPPSRIEAMDPIRRSTPLGPIAAETPEASQKRVAVESCRS